jgi:hypothetical protein
VNEAIPAIAYHYWRLVVGVFQAYTTKEVQL